MTQMMPLNWILFLFMIMMFMMMNVMIYGFINNVLFMYLNKFNNSLVMKWYW